MIRSSLVAAAVLACLLPAPGRGDQEPVPLRDALRARGGKVPVYLAYGEGGVSASAADGSWSVPLVEGAVDTAAYDAGQDLVWLVRGGRLEVLDLREPSPAAVPIVERWFIQTEGFVSKPVVSVTGTSEADADTTYAGVHPMLVWKAKPKISTGEGAYGGIWEEQDAAAKKAIRKAKIVGAKWLADQAGRKAHPAPPRPSQADAGKRKHVKLPKGVGECEDEDMCGDARPFGPTSWLIVVVQYSCGDACHTACLLYDPATKKLAAPTAPTTWSKSAEAGACEGYSFDAEGKLWLAGDKVCTTQGCTAIGKKLAFAWLDGGARI